jgi:hypothetical protein
MSILEVFKGKTLTAIVALSVGFGLAPISSAEARKFSNASLKGFTVRIQHDGRDAYPK